MNERIKELMEQAGASRRDGVGGLVFRDSELEKFAELIVRECIDTAFNKGHPDLEFLLKHFGVELDITTHKTKLTTDPERIRQANYLLNGGR